MRWLARRLKESGIKMPPLGAEDQGSGQGRELIERVLPHHFDARTMFALEAMASIARFRFPALNAR
jgi:hypothetical protein